MNQLFLLDHNNPFKLFAPQQGRRKSKRPLSPRHPIHVVLKSKSADRKLLRGEKYHTPDVVMFNVGCNFVDGRPTWW